MLSTGFTKFLRIISPVIRTDNSTSNQLVGLLTAIAAVKNHQDYMHSTNHINNSAPTCDVLWCFRHVKLYCNFMVLQSEFLPSELLNLCAQAEVKRQIYVWFARVGNTDQHSTTLIQFSWAHYALWEKVSHECLLWRCDVILLYGHHSPYYTSHHITQSQQRAEG